ncbi:MAG: arsenate reductase ArsC [Formosimonas sp.]
MMLNILILCTHNSARSALGEAMLNHWARQLNVGVQAYSAGSAPSGKTNPHALAVLEAAGVDISYLHSKSWDEFSRTDAPTIDVVITVCDSAAGEVCPLFSGAAQQVKVHWGYPDPSNSDEAHKRAAFEVMRQAIGYRMLMLLDFLANLTDEPSNGATLKQAWHHLPANVRKAQLNTVLSQ